MWVPILSGASALAVRTLTCVHINTHMWDGVRVHVSIHLCSSTGV